MAVNRTSPVLRIYTLFIFLCAELIIADGYRILLFPMSHGVSSHVNDMVKMAAILERAGDDVHIALASTSPQSTRLRQDSLHVHVYAAPADVRTTDDADWKRMMLTADGLQFLQFTLDWLKMNAQYCRALFKDQAFLASLREYRFDVVLFDVTEQCGKLVGQYLKTPCMEYSGVGYVTTEHALFPNFPSYVPHIFSPFSDQMTFTQRVMNFYMGLLTKVMAAWLYQPAFLDIARQHGLQYDVASVKDALHLVQASPALDFPRPLLPSVVNIGGVFTKPAGPLNKDFERFIQAYATHGVVLVTFGSLMDALDPVRAGILAEIFASLPQGVIWRHKGEPPVGLGNNTLLVDWLPQNDLLGHTATRLFVSHCGMASTYEAAYHGVPVLALPLYADQYQNAAKMAARAKMAEVMDIHSLDRTLLRNKILTLLDDPVYKVNAMRTSVLLKEMVTPPADVLVHSVHVTARHQGAKHLHSAALHTLNWLQLYSLDVMMVSLAAVFVTVMISLCVVRRMLSILRRLAGHKHTKCD